ncbi:MAG TPA: HAMP domain-containing sensor histidine kinase [Lacipirellulaceae bacterium]|nr:HAMP domain-containing sensor histidine kinase [Lacipirellulaceae bacterium]
MNAPMHHLWEQGGTHEDCERVCRRAEFLAVLAQELRSSLAPIQHALELIRLCPADRLASARAREVASEQVGYLSRLVNDLVDVSRLIQGRIRLRKQAVELVEVMDQSVEIVRNRIDDRCQQLFVSVPREPARIEVDPVRLVQILSQLLQNAAKFTPYGGSIWLSASYDEKGIVLRVRDTGVGISPQLLPRIFDLFTHGEGEASRSQGGLGIGLTIVRALVELHGGYVIGRSDGLGRGSEFVVRLPDCAKEVRCDASCRLKPT